ncbi:MAG: polyprenol monophosphomannose synthase [Candidatus Aminicenantes bacterium]|nr:polyprenol monophosphomannose synthase [Candidatus Aminicenantes bacterium]
MAIIKTNKMSRSNTSEKKISVVLPTYNEKENIVVLIENIFSHLDQNTEVLVVDDNSPDGTWQIVEELTETYPNLRLLRRLDKRGLTSALNDGIKAAKGDIVAWMDCDLSMPPEKLKELKDKIDEGYDAAVASRFVKGGGVEIRTGSTDTVFAYILSLCLNRFIQTILDSSFKDYTSGFIMIKKSILEEIPLKGDYGEYFIDLIHRTRKKGYKTIEIPYLCRARNQGVSKTGTNIFQYLKRGSKYLKMTLGLKFSKL